MIDTTTWSDQDLLDCAETLDVVRRSTGEQVRDLVLQKKLRLGWLAAANLCMAGNGVLFRKDAEGCLSALMRMMYEDRKRYKREMLQAKKDLEAATDEAEKRRLKNEVSRLDNLQMAKKIQLNSAFGVISNGFFVFFDLDNAEAITLSGQVAIRWLEDWLNRVLNEAMGTTGVDYVIAADTDSLYLDLGKVVEAKFPGRPVQDTVDWVDRLIEKAIQPRVDQACSALVDYGCSADNRLQMKREAIASAGIWTAKKRYVLDVHDNEGVRYKAPKLKMMGIETVRSSTPAACRKAIERGLEIVMRGTREELEAHVEQVRTDFKTLPYSKIAFPRGINGMAKYWSASDLCAKGTPIQVRGALVYNRELQRRGLSGRYVPIYDGDKARFCYLRTPNPFQSHVISIQDEPPPELDLDRWLDRDAQFEKSFIEPMEGLLSVVGWSTRQRSSLEDFFGG